MADKPPPLHCDDEGRRVDVSERRNLHGIDYIEVATAPPADNQRLLRVHFIPKTSEMGEHSLRRLLEALVEHPDKFRVEGGVRVSEVVVTSVRLSPGGDHLEVRVSEPGDFSTYTLAIDPVQVGEPRSAEGRQEPPELDPAFSRCDFSFKAGCPSRFDCVPRERARAPVGPGPVIDYMAKDYASFRQAMLDRITMLVPSWTERHEADLGVALIELLAYAGDQLSYHQDAVANEAFLSTARQRISVRRHARLVDYAMHDGASARTFVQFAARRGRAARIPRGTKVLSLAASRAEWPASEPLVPARSVDDALRRADAVFETLAEVEVHRRLNEVRIHAWGNRRCCLPPGTTSLDLLGDLMPRAGQGDEPTWRLQVGDYLLLEEVLGPVTRLAGDADPAHRQVVRLTRVEEVRDPLLDDWTITRVGWDAADALTFPLCVETFYDDEGAGRGAEERHPLDGRPVSVARGNLVLADHGLTISESHAHALPSPRGTRRRAARLRLAERPLSARLPLPSDLPVPAPASALWDTDPREARPQVTRVRVHAGQSESDWTPEHPDLLDAGPFDRRFAVETDNDDRAVLRFGDGEFGLALPDQARLDVDYRVGVGRGGNLGAEALGHFIAPERRRLRWPRQVLWVRNPLPAWGGADPEPLEQVRQRAPAAFRVERLFAATEEDYARAAERHPEVQRAVATFRWTGSWHTVFVTVDPRGRAELTPELDERLRSFIGEFAQAGYDLEIESPALVPLDLALEVCAAADHFRTDVEEAVIRALGAGTTASGERGFFHPDRFTFGQPLYLSAVYAAAKRVPGVDSVVVRRFQRYARAAAGELEQGFIPAGRLEVLRLDNDPSLPENGVLEVTVRGGK